MYFFIKINIICPQNPFVGRAWSCIFLSSKIVVIQRVSFWIGNLTFFILLYLNLSRQDLFNLLLDLLSIQSISTCAEGPNQREDEFTIDYCGSVLDITEAGIELGVLEIFD